MHTPLSLAAPREAARAFEELFNAAGALGLAWFRRAPEASSPRRRRLHVRPPSSSLANAGRRRNPLAQQEDGPPSLRSEPPRTATPEPLHVAKGLLVLRLPLCTARKARSGAPSRDETSSTSFGPMTRLRSGATSCSSDSVEPFEGLDGERHRLHRRSLDDEAMEQAERPLRRPSLGAKRLHRPSDETIDGQRAEILFARSVAQLALRPLGGA